MEQLKSITKIAEFPYRLYYMHFDLDCVSGGKPCYTSAEKRICTNNFCQMINGDLTKFIKFFNDPNLISGKNYDETWSNIASDSDQFRIQSNINLLFEFLEEKGYKNI